MSSVCRSRSCEVLAWLLSYSMWILGGSIQGGVTNGIIFSTDPRVIFHCGSNRAVRASRGVSLRNLRLDLIWATWEYLVDVASLSRLSPNSISRRSLGGNIPASTSRAGLDVALYAPVIIRMALVCTDSRVANGPFPCPFTSGGRYQTEHAYVNCGTMTAKYIWRSFRRLPPHVVPPACLMHSRFSSICF